MHCRGSGVSSWSQAAWELWLRPHHGSLVLHVRHQPGKGLDLEVCPMSAPSQPCCSSLSCLDTNFILRSPLPARRCSPGMVFDSWERAGNSRAACSGGRAPEPASHACSSVPPSGPLQARVSQVGASARYLLGSENFGAIFVSSHTQTVKKKSQEKEGEGSSYRRACSVPGTESAKRRKCPPVMV
jgi:hypothetical protein